MNQIEKEYQEFMIKLADKANEVQKDFAKLFPENQERVRQSINYMAITELIKMLNQRQR